MQETLQCLFVCGGVVDFMEVSFHAINTWMLSAQSHGFQ